MDISVKQNLIIPAKKKHLSTSLAFSLQDGDNSSGATKFSRPRGHFFMIFQLNNVALKSGRSKVSILLSRNPLKIAELNWDGVTRQG